MNDDIDFASAPAALLRSAVLPLPAVGTGAMTDTWTDTWTDRAADPAAAPFADPAEERDRLREQILLLAGNPALMDAVRLASPSLADDIRRIVGGERVKRGKLRRAALSLVKYHLRMTHRPTPFGLFAGVAVARFGPLAAAELGTAHRPASRPDAGWLDGVLDTLYTEPDVRDRSRFVANDLRTVRDGRLVLLDRYDGAGTGQLAHSVRLTAVVRHALECAQDPLSWHDLVKLMADHFPQAPEGAVERSLVQLVRARFLLSSLTPPPDRTDPLGHVLEQLHGCDHPTARALRDIRAALHELDTVPSESRGRALTAATDAMRALHPAEHPLQMDLALDARVTLPKDVAREAERAATALWRTSVIRPGSASLRDYHLRFLEQYGTDRSVPVLELLDEARGLGLPDAYRQKTDAAPPRHPEADRRDRVLGELFLDATRRAATRPGQGVPELVLDEATLRSLAPEAPRDLPASLEIGAEIVAGSLADLESGDFRIVLGINPGSPLGGATFGRFAHVLADGEAVVEDIVRRSGEIDGEPGAPRTVGVAYRPRVIRSGNVATVPQWPTHRVPLGVGPAGSAEVRDIRVTDLVVHADLDRLHLVDRTTGEPVRPVSYSMLNPGSGHVPDVARFLLELGQEGRHWCLPWNWGAWSGAPVQPRVTYGRAVLSPARWLPDRELVDAAAGRDADWPRAVARWRRRWAVPRHVLLARADNRIAVDLDDPLHLLVCEDELKRAAGLTVVERVGGPQGSRWLNGPEGPHAAELVLPLFATRRPSPTTGPARELPSSAPALTRTPDPGWAQRTHLPGGDWLYAKVYVPEALQPQVLAGHLPRLTDPALLSRAAADSWFFLRYADPDPHLRLRFHGDPARLWPVLLPELRDWVQGLRAAGLADRLVLDSYDPETERYGGGASIGRAEQVFHADSETVLAQLAGPAGKIPDEVRGAWGVLAALTGLGTGHEALRWLSAEPFLARRADVPREHKRAVAALLDRHGRPTRPAAGSEALAARWAGRATALGALRDTLAQPAAHRAPVAMSLAHMHCNRLFGPRRELEVLAHITAREGLATHFDRERHTG